MVMSEKFVRRSIIKYLERRGYARNLKEKETHEQGVDIRVRNNKYARYFIIETKGESPSRSVNENSFVQSVGQIVTRMNTNARDYYGIGLPDNTAKIAIRRIPYKVAKKLQLYIFSVSKEGKVTEYSPKTIKKYQNPK